MLCYQKTPTFARVRNSTTDVPTCLSIMLFGFKKKGQIVQNMGKHRAKQELETVPPQELGTVPPKGSKNDLWGGTVSNSPVVLFPTLDLLVAAVKMCFFFFFLVGTVSNFWKGKKVVPKLTLRHAFYLYIYRERERGVFWAQYPTARAHPTPELGMILSVLR